MQTNALISQFKFKFAKATNAVTFFKANIYY